MIKLTIDGKNIEAEEGATILKAAEGAGIYVPTLCNHPQLTPYGGCRLCMVDVEGAPILQPSCTLPAVDGMVVRTHTEKVLKARKFVLTLIFSERNHFCMFCPVTDGDCELQNRAYDEDMTHWDLQPNWQPFNVDASHPYIVLDNNRCILCRRCVRACGELVGNFTLGFEERGADSLLVADYNVPLGESSCISCGICVQICPTGALIDRQSAYQGKETEVDHHIGVCVGCSVGCQCDVLTRDNRLVRIAGDWDAPLNHGLLCEKGRFLPLEDYRDRIFTPLNRKDGSLKATTWDEAISTLAEKLSNGKGVAALTSSRLPVEDLSLFKSIFADNLNADLVTTLEGGKATSTMAKTADKLGKPFEATLEALKDTDVVLSLELDLTDDYQVAGFFIKRQLMNGTKLIVADSTENKLAEVASITLPLKAGDESQFLTKLIAAVDEPSNNTELDKTAGLLKKSMKACIVYGKEFVSNADETTVILLLELAEKVNAKLIGVKGSTNSMAAAQLNLEAPIQLNGSHTAFVLLGHAAPSQKLIRELENVPFVIVLATHRSQLTGNADVVLPVADWAEHAGTYLSLDGKLQKAVKALETPEGVFSSQEVLLRIASSLSIDPELDWKSSLMNRVPTVEIQEA